VREGQRTIARTIRVMTSARETHLVMLLDLPTVVSTMVVMAHRSVIREGIGMVGTTAACLGEWL
jgi:hypothetical protein